MLVVNHTITYTFIYLVVFSEAKTESSYPEIITAPIHPDSFMHRINNVFLPMSHEHVHLILTSNYV